MCTVFCRKALAKCWAPSSPIWLCSKSRWMSDWNRRKAFYEKHKYKTYFIMDQCHSQILCSFVCDTDSTDVWSCKCLHEKYDCSVPNKSKRKYTPPVSYSNVWAKDYSRNTGFFYWVEGSAGSLKKPIIQFLRNSLIVKHYRIFV